MPRNSPLMRVARWILALIGLVAVIRSGLGLGTGP